MSRSGPVPFVAVAALVLAGGPALAHPLAPSSLRLRAEPGGLVEVRWRTPSVGPAGQSLAPVLPGHCRPVGEPEAVLSRDRAAVEQLWRVDCGERGLVGSSLAVSGLSPAGTNVVVEVELPGGGSARGLLHEGRTRFVVPGAQRPAEVLWTYLVLGVEHLLSGLDHVLFVLGLLFLVSGGKLVQAVTAFTLGHSLSLALSVLGLVRVPEALVEVGIAATIVFLALEIVRSRSGGEPSRLERLPWALPAAFGLLHGLGFAGALQQAGLPEGAIPLALLGFNLGIEAGQLGLVAAATAARALAGRRLGAALPKAARLVPAYLLGSLAAFWVLERSVAALGLLGP